MTQPKRERLNRIQLVARVQIAYEQLKDAMSQGTSPAAKAAVAEARRRLSLLNRALALMALQAA